MLSIILCDDDPFILQLGAAKIGEIIEKNHWEAQIVCQARSSQELFAYRKKNQGDYLLFLDLDFGEDKLNGLDIAKLMKQQSPRSKIVFTTNHQEMAVEVLKSGVEPFGFLEKTTEIENLSAGYARYIQMAMGTQTPKEDQSEQITLSVGVEEEVSIAVDSIIYIEAVKSLSHGLCYHTIYGSAITVRGTIEAVQKELGEGFIRTHRSYLAQKKYLLRLEQGMITLANQETIPCAFRMQGEVKKWIR